MQSVAATADARIRIITTLAGNAGLPWQLQNNNQRHRPRGKSKIGAVCLSLIFGPLGLIYVNAWGAAFLAIAIGFRFVVTHKGGLWLTFGSRILSPVWAYCVLQQDDKAPNFRRDSLRMLNEAARLENVDRNKAIAAYERIAKDYSRD